MMQTKIATCCYCGRRTVLQPTAMHGHELACGACGAPIHLMKSLPVQKPGKTARSAVRKTGKPSKKSKDKPRKARKPLWKKVVADVWDEIEDIFD